MIRPGAKGGLAILMAMLSGVPVAAQLPDNGGGLTAVEGLKLGHFTLNERPTGCTVILAEDGAVGGVDVRGGAPGTRETDLLDPVNSVQHVHGVVLAGGSAFGLDAATGVVRYLEEQGRGFPVGDLVVPIVVGAILFDLNVGNAPSVRPDADCGYAAAASASAAPPAEGNVGAGAGAVVGKLRGSDRAMKGGLGTSAIRLPNGLVVSAVVAVNAVGSVIDPSTGQVVAGVRTPDGTELDDPKALLRGTGATTSSDGATNTTIGVVATNATLTQAQATKVAQMAQDGLARAIYPAHTPWDGDTVFSLATGTLEAEVSTGVVGALAADVMAEAIVRAVKAATESAGYPSVHEVAPRP